MTQTSTQAQIMERQNENHIILWFSDFDYLHEEISKKLSLAPTSIQLLNPDLERNKYYAGKRNFSYWEYEWTPDSSEFIGDVAERFIKEIVKPRAQAIKELRATTVGEFKIVQYYYEGCNPGYHLTIEAMSILVEANLELDIDTYCLAGSR